ncbi:MAG: hypothetical protein IKO53_00145 [Lachnospiraceae bacterium]|nr:hypothetical protein [Lachnospiraceae bacterium]
MVSASILGWSSSVISWIQKGNNAGCWIRKIERNMERDTEKDHTDQVTIRAWGNSQGIFEYD